MSEETPVTETPSTTTPETPEPVAPNSEEYKAQMTVKGLMATNQVPEKFIDKETGEVNVEKWAKSYTELEKKFHNKETPEDAVEDTPPPTVNEEFPETLQIKEPEPEPVEAEKTEGVSVEDWSRWKAEIMKTNALSDETKEEISKRLQVDDVIINDFIEAQRAHLQEGLRKAANVVGGHEKMTEIFKWATNNLDERTREYVNSGLEGPAWEVTLRGLEQQYNAAMASKPSSEEMQHKATVSNPAGVDTSQPYGTVLEFTKERADPRYGKDVRYTNYVNDRASRTPWDKIS